MHIKSQIAISEWSIIVLENNALKTKAHWNTSGYVLMIDFNLDHIAAPKTLSMKVLKIVYN